MIHTCKKEFHNLNHDWNIRCQVYQFNTIIRVFPCKDWYVHTVVQHWGTIFYHQENNDRESKAAILQISKKIINTEQNMVNQNAFML